LKTEKTNTYVSEALIDTIERACEVPMRSVGLVALEDWMSTAQLPETFARLGAEVVGLCKPDAPVAASKYLSGVVTYSGELVSDLERLIDAYGPATLVACDEDAVHAIVALAEDPGLSLRLRRLLQRSFGNLVGYRTMTSKWDTLELAAQAGISAPQQARIETVEQALAFADTAGYPIILKEEKTYGGKGCYLCWSARDTIANCIAIQYGGLIRKLRRWPRLLSLFRFALARRPPVRAEPFIVQRYHPGTLAFCAAVARDGVMLRGFSVLAEQPHPKLGPSTVVRQIDNADMLDATRTLIGTSGLSGFVGIDFVLDRTNGQPYLLEVNPRVTAVARLGDLFGTDICSLFIEAMLGTKPEVSSPQRTDMIALFPYEWIRDRRSPYLRDVFVDVPYNDPKVLARFYQSLPLSRKLLLALGLPGTLPDACWTRNGVPE
jgi:hypothetical protein